ncbi:hypothetical protein TOPH_04586 [Tolypocladium ophioglossoides CBS 100239]|uniref:Uncharacterized protein n=1 Tax=Tolypocladium ophioglossoides (strain CBS 100239) TaxID=1163406 RepID=A0A0L0N9T0_TOLOC|nr:hypothetical protein TOPH_04586 [Tolypocladium ophioglossoides CBS 100239]
MDQGLWDGNGVFDVVDKLHTRGWSFGQGELRFNRTLDIFYLAQIAAGTYRSSDQLDGEFPSPEDFDMFYAQHHQLLGEDTWRQYYSPAVLAQAMTARFYRPPDLQDLPDSSDPLGLPRQKGIGHFIKLPRWARNVAQTHRRQPTLPVATITQIALSTLQQTISRLRKDCPNVQPYSETQARFWLEHMELGSPRLLPSVAWKPNDFGICVAQGAFDTWAWEAYYSRERWESSTDAPYLEPDLDGTRESEVHWCGWPDGGLSMQAWWRRWEPEVGSEEEIAFLAAVAAKEMEGVDASSLDSAMRSHLLLGVMCAAFEMERREEHVEDLKRRMVGASRIDDEGKAEQWIRQALMVMEPYVRRMDGWPAAVEDRSELLRHILVENGQLFARYKLAPLPKEFSFELKPRE